MNIRVPHYYKEFKCIGDKCSDTCCAGWEVVVDDEASLYYKTVEGPFGDRLRSHMVIDQDEETVFVLHNGNCPFLNEKKLCDIYTELGEDKLCTTCTEFPRFTEEFEDLREIGISLSCPEAARILLDSEIPVTFEIKSNEEKIIEEDELDSELFKHLIDARKTAIHILQNRSMNIDDRIAVLLTFTKNIQDKMDRDKVDMLSGINEQYMQDDFIDTVLKKLEIYREKYFIKYELIQEYLQICLDMENINESWPKTVEDTIAILFENGMDSQKYKDEHFKFNTYYAERMYEYEHLMVYYIFRYFMKAVYDADVFSKVKLAVTGYLIMKELDVAKWMANGHTLNKEEQVDLMHLYSREVEHSDDNLEILDEEFKINSGFNFENMLIAILS